MSGEALAHAEGEVQDDHDDQRGQKAHREGPGLLHPPEAVLTGVESRSSSPVRILRGEDFQSPIRGLYPCGEGAGYAGGITSAAVDGIRVAEAIASK